MNGLNQYSCSPMNPKNKSHYLFRMFGRLGDPDWQTSKQVLNLITDMDECFVLSEVLMNMSSDLAACCECPGFTHRSRRFP